MLCMSEPDSTDSIVELRTAVLPRESMGPFLILGLDKGASPEEVDKAWRERLQWVEQGWWNVSCDDLNWAHDVLLDPERRVAADAASLNPDTLAQPCRHLLTTSESADWEQPTWPILDDAWPECPLSHPIYLKIVPPRSEPLPSLRFPARFRLSRGSSSNGSTDQSIHGSCKSRRRPILPGIRFLKITVSTDRAPGETVKQRLLGQWTCGVPHAGAIEISNQLIRPGCS